MKKLYSLNFGESFTWNKKRYTINGHEQGMTEVFSNGKMWAWPSGCMVQVRN